MTEILQIALITAKQKAEGYAEGERGKEGTPTSVSYLISLLEQEIGAALWDQAGNYDALTIHQRREVAIRALWAANYPPDDSYHF